MLSGGKIYRGIIIIVPAQSKMMQKCLAPGRRVCRRDETGIFEPSAYYPMAVAEWQALEAGAKSKRVGTAAQVDGNRKRKSGRAKSGIAERLGQNQAIE